MTQASGCERGELAELWAAIDTCLEAGSLACFLAVCLRVAP